MSAPQFLVKLTARQMSVLRRLAEDVASSAVGMSSDEILKSLDAPPSQKLFFLVPLMRKGLVEREADLRQDRSWRWRITALGLARVEAETA